MELSNNKWDFYANVVFMEPHFDFYWQWRPLFVIACELIWKSFCQFAFCKFLFRLISINFLYFRSLKNEKLMKFLKRRKRNGLNLRDRKQQELHLHLRVFLKRYQTSTYGKYEKENIFEHSSLSLSHVQKKTFLFPIAEPICVCKKEKRSKYSHEKCLEKLLV